MLAQRQKVAIRRHLGVPFAGTAQAGRLFGWRFAIHVEDLEWKMSNLQPNEEQLITGNAVGSWGIYDVPTIGDVLTFNVIDALGTHSVPYTVTFADLHPQQNIVNPSEASVTFQIALNVATAINLALNARGYQASAAAPADIPAPPYFAPYFSEVIITGPGPTVFAISASVVGTTNVIVQEQVYPSPVTAQINGTQLYGYVALLDALSMRVLSADLTLWIEKADVVTFRKDEVRARKAPYRYTAEMLSRDLGGKEYIDHFFSGGGGPATA